MLSVFTWGSAGALLAVVALRSRPPGALLAIFAFVLLGVHTLVSCALAPRFGPLLPVYGYFQAAVYVHFAMLVRARMRSLPYRVLVSLPASFFTAGTLLAVPWAIVGAFGVHPYGFWMPYALAALGLAQSLYQRFEEVDVTLDGAHAQR